MRWTKDHDLILVKEILLFEPFNQKKRVQREEECGNKLQAALVDNVMMET